jgi:copper chaperone CopZ
MSSRIPLGGIQMRESSYSVPAVSCDHCRHAIVAEVGGVPGVTAVDVDLEGKVVVVRGEAFDDREVRAAIEDAGYDVQGSPA